MNAVPKVLVVDNGERSVEGALSVELAELGYASVTTSVEAAEDVLAVLPTPSAVLLQLPLTSDPARHQEFRSLAARLKANPELAGIPVVTVEPKRAGQVLSGAFHRIEDPFGVHARQARPGVSKSSSSSPFLEPMTGTFVGSPPPAARDT